MGNVNQEAILFNASFKDNIRFGKTNATDEEIEHAAKIANAYNFIMQSEHGFDTNIGDRGGRLSGGQRQRVSIARAILSKTQAFMGRKERWRSKTGRTQNNITVYICSNDPKLDKASYQEHLQGMKVIFPQGGQEDDLCLLSECDYLIGAPSTFSLVASMYHDTPLCWMEEKQVELSASSFGMFNELFRHIR